MKGDPRATASFPPPLYARAAARFIAPLAITLILLLPPTAAQAGEITTNLFCTLPDAITAANLDSDVNDCVHEGDPGPDTIVLTSDATLSTAPFDPDGNGPTGTPAITTTIIIDGGEGDGIGGGSFIQRAGGTEPFRLLYVGEGGDLTLQDVTVFNGYSAGNGGAIYNRGSLTLDDTKVISNTAASAGGAIYNGHSATATLIDSEVSLNLASDGGGLSNAPNVELTLDNTLVIFNRAIASGGGLHSVYYGTVFATGSQIDSNTAGGDGGGSYGYFAGEFKATGTTIRSNKANRGAGFYTYVSPIRLDNVTISSNQAITDGGGIYNYFGSLLQISNSTVFSNTTGGDGAGLANVKATSIITATDFISNQATIAGGGIENFDGEITLTDVEFRNNTASTAGAIENIERSTLTMSDAKLRNNGAFSGGGIKNADNSKLTITNSELRNNGAFLAGALYNTATSTATLDLVNFVANSALLDGGIVNDENSALAITNSKFLSNTAPFGAGAIDSIASTTINQSCIVGNGFTLSNPAVIQAGATSFNATNNWWGASDGPGGMAPGTGDSIAGNATTAPFLSAPILDCPTYTAEVTFSKRATPSGNLLPGQPLTYTVVITNHAALTVTNGFVSDPLPAGFQLSQVITTGSVITVQKGGFRIAALAPNQPVTLHLVGKVNPTLAGDQVLTNSATFSHTWSGAESAAAANNVVLPKVAWASTSYTTTNDSDRFTATVTLTPPTPYVTVMVQVLVTDTSASSGAVATVAAGQTLTFPPNSSSQPVLVTLDSNADEPHTIQLALQSPSGATLGAGGSATISVSTIKDEAAIFLPLLSKK